MKERHLLSIVFLTLFLDVVSFSIIFPYFPAMSHYYYAHSPHHPFILFFTNLTSFWPLDPSVLFGAILSALYSFFQVVMAPIWGNISDKVGRRPILLLSSIGMIFATLLWPLADTVTLILFNRMFCGLFSGNISTASAAVTDATSPQTRGKGMAVMGMAFALGFIVGPAIGGAAHLIQLEMANPFAAPGMIAFFLSIINFSIIFFFYKETHHISCHEKAPKEIILDKSLFLINATHLIFMFLISGLEFTLLFLLADRFHYAPHDNAFIFIYLGTLMILIQGGIIRRFSKYQIHLPLAQIGHLLLLVAFLTIGLATTNVQLYTGLSFMGIGTALISPSLNALASLCAPKTKQGYYLGIFRSYGSMGRLLGPLLASVIYWQYGPSSPYLLSPVMIGVVFILLFLLATSPSSKPKQSSPQ